VLDAMVKDGDLDAASRAKQVFPEIKAKAGTASLSGQKGYMIEAAKQAAAQELGISKDEVEKRGLAIVTTFQQKLVVAGAKAVKDQLLSVKGRPKTIQAGLVTIDPKTGAVRAIYGGPDYLTHQYNNALQGGAQAGSTFKPFGLIAALEDNVSLKSRFSGASPQKFDGKKVRNFGNESLRTMNLIDATAHSVNTVYVALNQEVGPEKTQKAAWDAGIPKSANVEDNIVNVLGTANPRVVDMANAYATFASGGIRHKWYVVQSIGTVSSGKRNNKYDHNNDDAENKPVRVFDERHVRDLTYAMRQVVERGSGNYAKALHREVAGKTGTSSESKSAWFIGFTPQYVTAVAMWQDSGDPKNPAQIAMKGFGGFRNITGGSFPVRIWTQYMEAALNDKEEIDFEGPVYDGEFTGTPVPTPVFTTTAPTVTASPEPTATRGPKPTHSRPVETRPGPFPTTDPEKTNKTP
jgi:membrane peptidoglycan carboxypeptidase